jgi:hypothetical protein
LRFWVATVDLDVGVRRQRNPDLGGHRSETGYISG